MSDLTRAEAIAIIHQEYLCVDRNCDIERSCGKCDLAMPRKEPILEAYKMAIKALEQIPDLKEAYQKGYKDGQEALAYHLELCKDEGSIIEIPEGATNGEVFQILFPCDDVIEDGLQEGFVDISMKSDSSTMYTFEKTWWNSPYRKEKEQE